MNRTGAALLLVAGVGVIAVTLALWGQPLVSASGEIRLWVNSIWSPETSQQVADWYSVSHLVQGMLLALLLRALPLRRLDTVLLWSAFAIGVSWELAEHTDFVLDRFRATTLYQGYLGDTVLNAVMDYVFMLAGVALARAAGGGRAGACGGAGACQQSDRAGQPDAEHAAGGGAAAGGGRLAGSDPARPALTARDLQSEALPAIRPRWPGATRFQTS